jgi:hypothetical protein
MIGQKGLVMTECEQVLDHSMFGYIAIFMNMTRPDGSEDILD